MTLPVLETSRSDAKPVELYRFSMEPQNVEAAGETTFFTDAMSYLDEAAAAAAGWTTVSQPTNPVTWSAGGVTFHRTAQGTSSTVSKTVAVPAGALVACEFTWEANGHWFEPLTVRITSGVNTATRGANPPTDGTTGGDTRRTSFITASAAEVTITISIHDGYGNGISHDDLYTVSFIRLIIITEGVEITLPVTELFFARGERDFVFQGDTYLKSAFNRTSLRSGDGESNERVELRMPRNHPVAQLFHRGPSTLPVKVTMFHVHRQDLVAGDSFITPFVGQVGQSYFDGAECVLTLESLRALLGFKAPSMLVSSKCANFLYDRQCGLNRENFRFQGTVSAIDDFTMTITGLNAASGTDASRFQFGFIIAPSGEHLFIEQQSGDSVLLLSPPQYTSAGDVVLVYWGCDRTAEMCHTKFNNIVHHNGRKLMPKRNNWTGAGFN